MTQRFPGVRRLFRIRAVERDLDEELSFHFEQTVAELMAAGASEAHARLEARRRFGDERHWRDEMERIDRSAASRRRRADLLATFVENVRYAFRGIVRAPGFAAAVVLTFALGIGANATMFGIVDRLLLRPPLHVEDPDAVRHVLLDRYIDFRDARDTTTSFNYPAYTDFQQARSLAGVAAYTGAQEVAVGRGMDAERFDARLVTASFFPLLGVQPALGRFFTEAEDRIGGEAVMVLSYEAWRAHHDGAASALGRTVDFGSGPYTIIGVAPRGFTGVTLNAVDFWLPLHQTAAVQQGTDWQSSRRWWWLSMVARLAPGVTPAQFEAEATTLHVTGMKEQIERGHYRDDSRIVASDLIAARGAMASGESKVARWLAGVSLLVLLIACANVANLLLARALRQSREIAVRMALGVSRARLMAQLLTEALVLALLGGIAAMLVARWGGEFVRAALLPDVAWFDAAGTRVLSFVMLAVLVCVLFAGLLPAIQASRPDMAASIRSGGRGVLGSGSRARSVLTVAQAALSVLLLVGAGLFVRSLHAVNSIDLGFEPEGLYSLAPEFDSELPRAEAFRYFEQAVERIATVPGVVGVTTSVGMPFWSSYGITLSVEGVDSIPDLPGGGPYYTAVDPGYFRTMGLRLVRGRPIEPGDRESAPFAAVINETMAHALWPREDPLGRCLYVAEGPCRRIVGIVENANTSQLVDEGPALQYYVALAQRVPSGAPGTVMLRVAGDPATVLREAQRAALAVDPRVRIVQVRSFEELIDPQRRSWILGATMFSLFGLLAIVVAAIGLYSVLAFEVAQRRQEIGVRAALGATRARIVSLVMRRGVRLAGTGVLLGAALAILFAPRMEALLYGVAPRDPAVMLGVMAALLAVAAAASGLPAWRASRIDPNVALRAE